MGYYSIVSDRDNMISEFYGSYNCGTCQLLNLYSSSAQYKNAGARKQDKTRLLIHFSLSALEAKINAGTIPSPVVNGTTSAYLKLTNCIHRFDEPSSFDVQIYPLLTDWVEGSKASEEFKESDFSNWNFAKRNIAWATGVSGGHFDRTLSSSYSFSHVGENLRVDVTNILNQWLSGATANNGFIIKLTDLDESLTSIHIKKFFSRQSETPYPPQLEIVYDDWVHDDREVSQFGTSSHIYLYNVVQGQFQDLITSSSSGTFPGKISISANNKSVSISAGIEATRVGKGKYRAYYQLPWAQKSATSFNDYWSITAPFNYTITSDITALNPYSSPTVSNLQAKNLLINYFNLDEEIQKGNVIRIDVTIVEDKFDQYINVSHAFNDDQIYIKDGEFRIVASDGTPISTWQKISYDAQGNFIMLDTDSLVNRFYYKLQLKFPYRDETIINFSKEFFVKD